MKKFYILWMWLLAFTAIGQTQIKVMSYNLMLYPNDGPANRKTHLQYILNTYQPDILITCELEDEPGADEVLNYCLGTQDYAMGSFIYNQSGSYFLQQMVYYNKHKFELIYETAVVTTVRDINHYTLKMRSTNANTQPVILEVYAAHLKASQGTQNENRRLQMVQGFTNDLQNIPAGRFVIFAGDLNMYYNTEPAYQELMDASNAIVMKDPINRPGYWHNNSSFAAIHSQSTHNQSGNDFVGGGLDDRFDFILISENMESSPLLHYVPNSFKAFGNNGNCYNKSINDNSCTGTYDMTLRNHLYNMSDHLPVVMELESNQQIVGIDEMQNELNVYAKYSHNTLTINGNDNKVYAIKIYDTAGQLLYEQQNYHLNESISLDNFKNAIYFIHLQQENQIKTFKFVKPD